MFIKFDELEMLEFFGNEPISIGEYDGAKYIYTIEDTNQFTMLMTVDTYAKTISVNIKYCSNTIFAGEFDGVLEITKNDDNLLVKLADKKRLIIKKRYCLGISIENL